MKINAKLYDGTSSKEQSVVVEFSTNKHLIIESHNIDIPLSSVKISSRLGNTPRVINLPNGMRCKSSQNDTIDAILKELNYKTSFISKLERSWKVSLGAVALIGAIVIFSVTIGADSVASYIASKLPQTTLQSASKHTLAMLDKNYLHKSNLSEKKKEQIRALFKKLVGNDKHYHLHFRSSPQMGPNAFALPNGDVVVIDSIVYLDKDPHLYGLLGVLAHEKGHVVYKHGLKGLIKGAIGGSIVGYISGDLSIITSALPTMILTSKYSREFETQADHYAKMQMHKMGLSTVPLAKLFINLEKFIHKKDKNSSSQNGFGWLASHPVTSKRIEYFLKN